MYYSIQENGRTKLDARLIKYEHEITPSSNRRSQIKQAFLQLKNEGFRLLPYVDDAKLAGSFALNCMIKSDNLVSVFVYLEPQFSEITPKSIITKLQRDLADQFGLSYVCEATCSVMLKTQACEFELIVMMAKHQTVLIADKHARQWREFSARKVGLLLRKADPQVIQLLKIAKAWQLKHYVSAGSSIGHWLDLLEQLSQVKSLREGLQILLQYYQWDDPIYSRFQIQRMDNYQFAQYCKDTLFGSDFPE